MTSGTGACSGGCLPGEALANGHEKPGTGPGLFGSSRRHQASEIMPMYVSAPPM